MKNIVIIGAGDLGKEVVWLIEDINKNKPTYVIKGFLDDDPMKANSIFYGYKVLGGTELLEKMGELWQTYAVIAIQDGGVRKQIAEQHPEFQHWESIIHPSAVIAYSSVVAEGCILFPQVTVSVESTLGSFGLYYIHSTVCNNCRIGEYVSIMSGASVMERAVVGSESFLAAGSCVYPHVRLGHRAKVGIEATVSDDHADDMKISER